MTATAMRRRMLLLSRTSLGALAAGLVLGCAATAHAQEAAGTADAAVAIDDVLVTAQKREQRARDVGISLNVFDQETLETRGVNSVEDLARLTPGLDVFDGNGTGNPSITLRGLGTTNPFLNNNPSVAVYADGVYLPFSSFLSLPFFDLERIEVLKGPQISLYGRNATAGAINLVSARPTRELTAYGDISYGSHDAVEARAAISGPLGDAVQARLSAIWQDGGGYIERPGTIGSTAGFTRSARVPGVAAVPAESGYGDKDVQAIRGSLTWQATNAVDVLVSAHYGRDRSELIGSTNINGDRLGVFRPPAARRAFVDYDDFAPVTDTEQYGAMIEADIDLGDFSLTSVTGVERFSRAYGIGDFVPTRIAAPVFDEEISTFGQDLRLAYTGSEVVNWMVGASYNREEIDYERVLIAYDFVLGALGTAFEQEDAAWAVYGEGEWFFHPDWFAGLGLRYTSESKDYVGGSFDIDPFGVSRVRLAFPGVGAAGLFGSPTYDEDDLSGRASLNWKPGDDLLVYASVNRGFKSGGIDGSGITQPSSFTPYHSETVWAYEIGVKSLLLADTLDLAASAFFYDYGDKQVLALLDLGSGVTEAVIQNAAAAEIAGLELDLRWRATPDLTVAVNGTVLESEVTGWSSANPAEIAARLGNDLPGTPKSQITVSLDHVQPLSSGLTLQTSFWASSVDGAYRDIENTEALMSERRVLVNGRVVLSSPRAGWSVYAHGENLFDEAYVTSVRSLVGMLGNYYGAPRTLKVGLRYEY